MRMDCVKYSNSISEGDSLRTDGRKAEELRKITIIKDFLLYPEGSCLIEWGDTKVICAASVVEGVPPFLKGSGRGWLTAEYSMIPRSTHTRMTREASQGKISGRTQEIQRLIGRSLRAAIDLGKIGEKTIWIDCDVIQADGGTRIASITGGWVALSRAVNKMLSQNIITENPIIRQIAGVSLGIMNGNILVDLNYQEDSSCEIDINLVMDEKYDLVEIQGTGERGLLGKKELDRVYNMAKKAVMKIMKIQRKATE